MPIIPGPRRRLKQEDGLHREILSHKTEAEQQNTSLTTYEASELMPFQVHNEKLDSSFYMNTQSSCRKLMAEELACVFLVTAEPWDAISVADLQASLHDLIMQTIRYLRLPAPI